MSAIIQVNKLVKKYQDGKTPAVDDISFSVAQGNFFALLGPNGAGKTTTISILTTLLSKSSGSVHIAGYDMDKHSNQIRREIGIIFQNPSLDKNLTAEENIRFHVCLYNLYPYKPFFAWMPQEYKQQILQLQEVLGLTPADMQKPVKDLSGGMKRKLEIIRSLTHKPKVLFLDEPTTGLDPISRKNLWEYLGDMRKKQQTTLFLTTHYLEEAEDADTVCIMNKGKIVANGDPAKIKSEYKAKNSSLEKAYLNIIQGTT